MHRRALLVLLAMTGCYTPLEDEAHVFVVPPGVDALVYGVPPAEVDYREGDPLVVYAFFHFSSELKRPTCEITVAGDTLTIQTSVKYKRNRGGGALWHAHAACQSEPLDAGTYTLVFDGRERVLTIPSTVEPPSFLWTED